MKKRKVLLALLVAGAMAVAIGCGAVETNAATETERLKTVYTKYEDYMEYTVFVDTETGVEYLFIDGNREAGLTVMVNPDSSPKIAKGYEHKTNTLSYKTSNT